jgi:GNAT superfamily N-acetyltransferase
MIVLLRAATEDDLAEVGALHYRSRAAAYAHFLSPEALTFGADGALGAWWAERFRWERDTHRMTVAEEDGEIVGFTYLGPGEEADTTELNAIHVDPAYQGTGVGRALMIDALAHLGDRAVLWVLEGNDRARRFYEGGGWAFDGTVREVPWDHEITRQLRYAYTAGLIGGRERATD